MAFVECEVNHGSPTAKSGIVVQELVFCYNFLHMPRHLQSIWKYETKEDRTRSSGSLARCQPPKHSQPCVAAMFTIYYKHAIKMDKETGKKYIFTVEQMMFVAQQPESYTI